MTSAALARHRSGAANASAALALLAGSVGVRTLLERSSMAGFGAGATFGALLLLGAALTGWRPRAPAAAPAAIGIAGGLVLAAIPSVLDPASAAFVGMRPQPWALWVVATVLVSAGEEVLLRGVLFDAVARWTGSIAAVAVTSVAFGLIHVPLYGWSVVPLDIAVGVWLGGLRMSSGSVLAPFLAHLIADLATW
jgi:membrane protease YdiL (CAAX protease family)